MIETRINQIKEAVGSLREFISQMGEPLSEENQVMLAKVLEHAGNRIKELRQPTFESNIPSDTGLLWNIAGGNADVFVDYLKSVPDPALNALLQNPTQLQNIIRRLEENQPQQRNRESDGVQQSPIQSSNVWGFNYDQNSNKLLVKFNEGGIYEYNNVPRHIFELFRRGAVPAKTEGQNNYGKWWKGKEPSIGAALAELIKKGGYPYQKVA